MGLKAVFRLEINSINGNSSIQVSLADTDRNLFKFIPNLNVNLKFKTLHNQARDLTVVSPLLKINTILNSFDTKSNLKSVSKFFQSFRYY